MSGDEIRSGSPLAHVLDDYPVPPLSAGFADRLLAAAESRAPTLSLSRRREPGRRWRTGRRVAIAALSFGALATAAAATGMLVRVGLPLPTAQTLWAGLTSGETASVAAPVASKSDVAASAATVAAVEIDGPIDTPEELAEVFRRIDEVRQGRIEARREKIDERITQEIERRRAAGLRMPTFEEEATLRQRIEEVRARREEAVEARLTMRREEFERKIDNNETLTREDIIRPLRDEQQMLLRRERLQQLRRMSPEQRREALRQLPTKQRRALIKEYRARRDAATLGPDVPPAEAGPPTQVDAEAPDGQQP